MKEYYEVRVHCANCGFKGRISILKGYRVCMEYCPECNTVNLVAVDAYKHPSNKGSEK